MKKKNTSLYLVILLMVAILIGVGYAALSATLNINGRTTIEKASWDVHFENLSVTDGSVTATTPANIDGNSTTVNFGVTLTNPGDFYEFTVDEVNKGTIDAMVSTLSKTGLTEEQAKYLDYTVTYSDGTVVSEKQLLKADKKETIKVRVAFKKDITASDLPTADTTLDLSFTTTYVQADSTAIAIVHPVCRRATTLHTETCSSRTDSDGCKAGGYTQGATVTYGNLGTKGTLTSGDAFDCDVNGDGTFDPTKERFYYVSGKDGDSSSDYVTLIYYNNVSGGAPNPSTFSYELTFASDLTTYVGPNVAKQQLPTTEQWSNVSLSSVVRNITDEKGTVRVTDFSYAGTAARLLTAQEVNRACEITVGSYKIGDLDNCQYLMENTKYTNNSLIYGYWLETNRNKTSAALSGAWGVYSENRYVSNQSSGTANIYGVRPAIEVLKSKVSY